MSWTVGILIVSWLCIFSVSEATLGESCIVTENCTSTVEICTDGNCECNSGYFNVSDVCKLSSITVSLSAQSPSVVYGSDVVLTASITSEVPLNISNTIKWLKGPTDGSFTEFELTPSKYIQNDVSPGQVTLTIQSVNFDDTHAYQVKVGNIAGVTSNSNQVSLTVTGENPTVTGPGTITEMGTTVTIDCTASVSQGSPALTVVYWLLNGKNLNITNIAKYSGGTVSNPSLSINNIASADAGEYHCRATNLVGSTTSSQSVTLAPPSNVHISASQSVDPIYNGSSITITGSFSSNLSTENKWQKQIGAEFTDIDITDGRYAGSSLASPTPKLVITKVDLIDRTSFRFVVTNRVGFKQSESITLNVVDGSISVTLTPPSISVKYGEDVTLTATIESPATVTNIKWQKVSGGSASDLEINLDKYTQTDSGSGTVTLMIENVVFTDSGSYRVQVSNAAGTTKTSNWVSLNVKALEFNDNCINTVSCDSSLHLECSINKCLCVSNYYHKEQVCYAKSRLAPTITSITSTTSSFSVFWNPPNIDSELVTEYEVKWKGSGSSDQSSGRVNKTVNSLTVSSGLMSGQLYTVNVISHGNLTNPAKAFVVTSGDFQVRLSSISVTLTPPSISVKYGEDVTLTATIESPATVTNIKWQKVSGGSASDLNINLDKYTQTGSGSGTVTLMIKNVDFTDSGNYQVQVSNAAGTTETSNQVSLNVKALEFNDNCINIVSCNSSIHLECSNNRCLCVSNYYHKEQVCYAKSRLAPTITGITSTTSSFSVFWNPPNTDSELVTEYEVKWKVTGSSDQSSGRVNNSVNSLNVSSGLMSGQLYTVNVISHGNLTNPAKAFVVTSDDFQVKLGSISVTLTPPSISVKYGEDVTLTATIESPATVTNIKWQKVSGGSALDLNINLDKYTQTGSGSGTVTLMIKNVDFTDSGNYQVQVSNAAGTTETSNQVSLNVKALEFNDNCINTVSCNSSIHLECSNNRCLCVSNYYHKEQVCYAKSRLAPTITGITSTTSSFSVFWNPPNVDSELVTEYEVKWKVTGSSDQSSGRLNKSVNSLTVSSGLMSGQLYTVNVISHGNLTNPAKAFVVTSDDFQVRLVSSAPTNLAIDEIRSRRFRIIFNRPHNVNGFLAAYKILITKGRNCVQQILVYGHCSICMSTDGCPPPINYTVPNITNYDVSYTADGLDPYTHYMVKVVAINGKGEGHPVNETVWTNEEVPLQPRQITVSNIQSSSLTLAWTLPDPSPGNTTYTIYIYEGTDDVGSNFLMKDSTKVYGFETKMLSVTGLKEYWPYKFQVNAATEKGNRTSDFSSVFKTKLAVIKDDETTSTSSIIGSIVAVVVVVAVVVIGIFIWRRNRRHKKYKEQAITYADLNLDERTKVDQPYSLLEHGRTVKNKSVPLNSFYDNVVDLLNNNRQKLTKEYYELLQDTERSASTAATSKHNISKNRGNIIPYDFNRVKLCLPGANDYIDASVMLDKCYTLTSYPIAKTFGIFWQMVWEQSVSTIVVITEQSDARESWYFSDNEGTVRTIERIDVELLAKFQSSESVTMRKIKLSRGKHSKVVNHFHVISLEMTDLPDQILALINTVTQNNVKKIGPQVVHGGCTGIDNSGVYIAVDHAVKSVVSGGNEIDVYGTTRTVMKERMFSISSLEQYSAIYTCLQKYVQNSPACKNDATGAYEYLP